MVANTVWYGDVIEELIERTNTVAETKFLKWMEYNRDHPMARILLYVEFPKRYVWDQSRKEWKSRIQFNGKFGRIYHFPIRTGPTYFLRII